MGKVGRKINPARKKAIENGDKSFLRFCPKCGKETEHYTDNITRRQYGRKGLQHPHCIPCKKEYDRQRNLLPEKKEFNKWRDIQKKYGMSKDEWFWMYKEQGRECGMCSRELSINRNGSDPNSLSACIDHDHETNKIRGMLCNRCNVLLGFADDDVNLLQLGIIYLNEANGINDI